MGRVQDEKIKIFFRVKQNKKECCMQMRILDPAEKDIKDTRQAVPDLVIGYMIKDRLGQTEITYFPSSFQKLKPSWSV